VSLSDGTAKEGNIETWLWYTITGLVCGSLEGLKSNLGRLYIIVRSAVYLPTYANKLEFIRQTWELCVRDVQFEDLTR
jgi:hypothetical protein